MEGLQIFLWFFAAGVPLGALLKGNLAFAILAIVFETATYAFFKHQPFRAWCLKKGVEFLAFCGKIFFGGYGTGVSVFAWATALFLYSTNGVLRDGTISPMQELAFTGFILLLFVSIGLITWKKVMK